jgi:hypothetical protein
MANENFGIKTVGFILKMVFGSITWGRYVAKLTIGHSLGVLGDRASCFGIAIHPLARVIPYSAVLLISIALAFFGVHFQFESWTFLGESTCWPMLICFLFGVGLSVLSAGIFAIPISIFFLNQISLPGLVLLNLGSWIGADIYWIVGAKKSGIRKDLVVRTISTWLTAIAFLFSGGIFRQYFGSTMNQVEKFEQLLLLMIIFAGLDIFLGLVSMHFWFFFSKHERKMGIWPGYLLVSRLFVRDVQNLQKIAEDKRSRMIEQQNSFTEDERKKVPGFVLKAHQDEIKNITAFLELCSWLQTKVLYRNPLVLRKSK